MKRYATLYGIVTLAALLAVVAGLAYAQEPEPQQEHSPQAPLGTAFAYQGQLRAGGEPVTADCSMAFCLYDQDSGGSQVSPPLTYTVPINDGFFTQPLDFGSGAFTGDARWLDIRVMCPGDAGYADLGRQELTAAPYATYALSAPWSGLTGVPAGFADGIDDDTTYSGGTGLDLTGTVFSITPTYRLPQGCAGGQIAEWDGSSWQCGDDDTGAAGAYWSLTGNAGTIPGTHFLGTTDGVSLTLAVSGTTALRLEPTTGTPNLVGGYSGNWITAGVSAATISGGGHGTYRNRVTDIAGTVGGGSDNQAGDNAGTTSDAMYATAGGGGHNTASGGAATVGGGYSNIVSGYYATVPGGRENTAQGDYSFAAGRRAKAYNQGCFVWGDSYNGDVACNVNDAFIVRASGGVTMYTNSGLTSGMYLSAGGSSWNAVSDRARKENLEPVDNQELLDRLAEIEISTWNYTSQDPSIRHIGPMAQDFNALLPDLGGEGEEYINSLDADGVALAAIQGLYEQNQELQEQVNDLEVRLAALEAGGTASSTRSSLLPWSGALLAGVGLAWVFKREHIAALVRGEGR